jgi:hypothetical protein
LKRCVQIAETEINPDIGRPLKQEQCPVSHW